jgi:hypothetical protein
VSTLENNSEEDRRSWRLCYLHIGFEYPLVCLTEDEVGNEDVDECFDLDDGKSHADAGLSKTHET